MRGILEFPMTENQQRRLERARKSILAPSAMISSPVCVNVGDAIRGEIGDQNLKGHGILQVQGQAVATVCGVVERVNNLVFVRSHRSRYRPEVGDIVVGRVVEVIAKQWRVDINTNQEAKLMLSSMNMPDGIQRRRTAVDELNMRSIIEENDVISAEIRSVNADGSVQLQARSHKYGKLEKGQLLSTSPYLIKRRKQHFHYIEKYAVDMILGVNGYIWVGAHIDVRNQEKQGELVEVSETTYQSNAKDDFIPLEVRENICRLANSVRVLSALGFSLFLESIVNTFEASITWNFDIKDMLAPEFFVRITEKEAERRLTSM
eukprot:TRINITY_DN35830_c0_g1_i1.p1 TRINITY_DN35830_c0_g1~~TRINITY_DN35830_c0_g1_i1.p1  ORF type:complete len:319 (+),score=58.13 TRINITY_DN35830_c0_g1_i1:173-1129(+)